MSAKCRILKTLTAEGKTDEEIANMLGVSRRKVLYERKKLGIVSQNGHRGKRNGAGRPQKKEKMYSETEAALVSFMKRQQEIDSIYNSIDAGLRTGSMMNVCSPDWIRYCGSAYRYNRKKTKYICTDWTNGMPKQIPVSVVIKEKTSKIDKAVAWSGVNRI